MNRYRLLTAGVLSLALFTIACAVTAPTETKGIYSTPIHSSPQIPTPASSLFPTPSVTETFFEAAQRLSWALNLCEDKDYVYYKNDIGIWKYNKMEFKETCILEEMNVCYIALDNDVLYFMSYEQWDDKRIYELTADGEKKLICGAEDFEMLPIEVMGQTAPPVFYPSFFKHDNIFYIPYYKGEMVKYDNTRKMASVFNTDIDSYDFTGNKFYHTGFRKEKYQESNFVNEIDLQTGNQKKIYLTGEPAYMELIVFENELFFSNEYNSLCKYTEENGVEQLHNLSGQTEAMYLAFPSICNNDKLYYLLKMRDNTSNLYWYDPITGETGMKIESLDIIGGFSIFHNVLIYASFVDEKEKMEYILLDS